jgi:hypothetical protein
MAACRYYAGCACAALLHLHGLEVGHLLPF